MTYSSGVKRILFLVPVLALLFIAALIPGCSHETETVKPLKLKILSVDKEQGIEILLIANDETGEPIQIEGVMDVGLWYWDRKDLEYYPDFKIESQLVQKWHQIPLTFDDYTEAGAIIFLPYDQPHYFQGETGYMEVTLETAGGEILVVSRDDVDISHNVIYTQ